MGHNSKKCSPNYSHTLISSMGQNNKRFFTQGVFFREVCFLYRFIVTEDNHLEQIGEKETRKWSCKTLDLEHAKT